MRVILSGIPSFSTRPPLHRRVSTASHQIIYPPSAFSFPDNRKIAILPTACRSLDVFRDTCSITSGAAFFPKSSLQRACDGSMATVSRHQKQRGRTRVSKHRPAALQRASTQIHAKAHAHGENRKTCDKQQYLAQTPVKFLKSWGPSSLSGIARGFSPRFQGRGR